MPNEDFAARLKALAFIIKYGHDLFGAHTFDDAAANVVNYSLSNLGRCHASGYNWYILVYAVIHDLRIKSGTYDKPGTCCYRPVSLLLRQNGSCAHKHLRHL